MLHLTNNHKKNHMYQPDLGHGYGGLLGMCLTILLYGTARLTANTDPLELLHICSAIAATFAGLCTGLYYIKKIFFDRPK
jgi:hypothetical protein